MTSARLTQWAKLAGLTIAVAWSFELWVTTPAPESLGQGALGLQGWLWVASGALAVISVLAVLWIRSWIPVVAAIGSGIVLGVGWLFQWTSHPPGFLGGILNGVSLLRDDLAQLWVVAGICAFLVDRAMNWKKSRGAIDAQKT